jgi:NAD(P)-dependent dehydrogenase (short-subunit alcohol dehydrogenase family)
MKRIIVTGGNRGIGKEICKQLAESGHEVILTARNVEKGRETAQQLGVDFFPLDLANHESIKSFGKRVSTGFDQIDVLINNAGIFIDQNQQARSVDFRIVSQTMQTNVYGPWQLINTLLPMLKKSTDPRIINISSGMGAMSEMTGGNPAYRMSKVALNALTMMIANETQGSIKVNSMCPGWVRTDMGGSGASRSVQKGAETAVWLATADQIPNGKFLRDKKIIDW